MSLGSDLNPAKRVCQCGKPLFGGYKCQQCVDATARTVLHKRRRKSGYQQRKDAHARKSKAVEAKYLAGPFAKYLKQIHSGDAR